MFMFSLQEGTYIWRLQNFTPSPFVRVALMQLISTVGRFWGTPSPKAAPQRGQSCLFFGHRSALLLIFVALPQTNLSPPLSPLSLTKKSKSGIGWVPLPTQHNIQECVWQRFDIEDLSWITSSGCIFVIVNPLQARFSRPQPWPPPSQCRHTLYMPPNSFRQINLKWCFWHNFKGQNWAT